MPQIIFLYCVPLCAVSLLRHGIFCGVLCHGFANGKWEMRWCHRTEYGRRKHSSFQGKEHRSGYWVGNVLNHSILLILKNKRIVSESSIFFLQALTLAISSC